MKRRIFIIALAFAAVTVGIGSSIASLLPNDAVATDVYVRVNPNSSSPLKFVGTFDITPGSNTLIVDIDDTRTAGDDTRIGYASNGTTVLTSSSAAHIDAGTVTIP